MPIQQEGPEHVMERVGEEPPGPHDYSGIVRELGLALQHLAWLVRLALGAWTTIADPATVELGLIDTTRTNLRNALGALNRRERALREKMTQDAADAPCDVVRLQGLGASGTETGFHCLTHRRTWGPGVTAADVPCAGWKIEA